jgi:hypothetical protein
MPVLQDEIAVILDLGALVSVILLTLNEHYGIKMTPVFSFDLPMTENYPERTTLPDR